MPSPGPLHPEPLPLQQSTADAYLLRHSTQCRLCLCGVSGPWCTQEFSQFAVILPSLPSIKGRLLLWPPTLMSSCLPDLSTRHLLSQTQFDPTELPHAPPPLLSHPILLPHGGGWSIHSSTFHARPTADLSPSPLTHCPSPSWPPASSSARVVCPSSPSGGV